MKPIERNPQFSNLLVGATSPYLRQHAHNPVYWYPWGPEALARAKAENKPILLSIGYSTCYWCHVMEREVFENVSIAALMNQNFINIKLDREEHPDIDNTYMVARQLMTHEGGWPNNIFLTPDLKPFYAGGTFGPADAYGKPGFPRLLEWLHFAWTTQEQDVRNTADEAFATIQQFLVYQPKESAAAFDISRATDQTIEALQKHYDVRSGGFYQAPKFPHEGYLDFLLSYHEFTGHVEAFDMVAQSLGKMAAGGINDHVGCGFHRYAVDKEWYVPHFEKMLYTQALLARLYTDTARLCGNPYFADIARSILDFVSGPMTDGNGAFYAAIDAETDGVEGAHYAWEVDEIERILSSEEADFFETFFALADIPAFPGHKHVKGQVIIARKPLFQAAMEYNIPYEQLSASVGAVMNKLLEERNKRVPPALDNKIIVSWNGLMIDAFAHAGDVLGHKRYVEIAHKAAQYILENAIDQEGRLCRVVTMGRPQLLATLEDYAYLIKGLITLARVAMDADMLETARQLTATAQMLFGDDASAGLYATQANDVVLVRPKSADDSNLPNANAVMILNWIHLYEITDDHSYLDRAQKALSYFLQDDGRIFLEYTTLLKAAQRLHAIQNQALPITPSTLAEHANLSVSSDLPDDVIQVRAQLEPENAKPGDACELRLTLSIKPGWHINAAQVQQSYLVPTQVDVYGAHVETVGILYPQAVEIHNAMNGERLSGYQGDINIVARLLIHTNLKGRPPIKAMIRLQPCNETSCYRARDISITI